MTKDSALKLALIALEEPKEHIAKHRRLEAITAIKEALANVPTSDTSQERVDETAKNRHEQEAQIVRWNCPCGNEVTFRGFTQAPQRKPLLASDIVTMYNENPRSDSEMIEFARAIEAAHGIKE